MKAPLYTVEGTEAGTIEVPDQIFNVPWNRALVKQVVAAERAKGRQPLAHTKNRGEVRGGGRKPWRQKHTGRARHGSIRSPIWRGGGATFGPRKERISAQKINRKMKRQAMFATLSLKLRENELFFLDALQLPVVKTKEFAKIIAKFPVKGRSVALISTGDERLERASRNIERLSVLLPAQLNTLELLSRKFVLFPREALGSLQKTFLSSEPSA